MLLLWFDVGKDRYTAVLCVPTTRIQLWFDVGKDRYTASVASYEIRTGCGLM